MTVGHSPGKGEEMTTQRGMEGGDTINIDVWKSHRGIYYVVLT